MKPSVLLISNGFQPSYEKAFANGLANQGVNVVLIASDRTLSADLDARIQVINLRGSQDPLRSPVAKARNIVRYVVALARHIRHSNYDVVHLTGLFVTGNHTAGLVEWAYYRLATKRFFMTVHNLLPHNRHTIYNRFLYRLIYKLPHVLVVHTAKMKAALSTEFGVDPSRIHLMEHGIDALPEKLRTPIASPMLRILSFGSLSPYKGTDLLLQALNHIDDTAIHLVIAGECRDDIYRHHIEQLINSVNDLHSVVWDRGFVAEDRVGDYFENTDVTILPYRHIDQSGVLFTSFRFGTPLVVTDVGSFRDYLPDYAGIVADEPTAEALAKAIREFACKRTTFDRKRIREHAQHMTWPNVVRPLVQVYRSTVSGSAA